MSVGNYHLLEKLIKAETNSGFLATGFNARIGALLSDYGTSDTIHQHQYRKVIKELNKNLSNFGLDQFLELYGPNDAGLAPIDVGTFFEDVTTIGSPDFLELEDRFLLLTEDSNQIILDQDV